MKLGEEIDFGFESLIRYETRERFSFSFFYFVFTVCLNNLFRPTSP